jgi:integrase/recombinase XerC
MRAVVDRFLRYLRVERNAAELTLKSYREDMLALEEYLRDARGGEPEAAAISTMDLRGYVAAMHEAGYAKSSIARRMASLRSFFRFAQREGHVSANPAKPLRNPRPERVLPHCLSTDEIQRLLEAPSSRRPLGLRDRAILETIYY